MAVSSMVAASLMTTKGWSTRMVALVVGMMGVMVKEWMVVGMVKESMMKESMVGVVVAMGMMRMNKGVVMEALLGRKHFVSVASVVC